MSHSTSSSLRTATTEHDRTRSRKRRLLMIVGYVLGSALLVIIGLGIWAWSVIPKPQGAQVHLQQALFAPPARPLPEDARFIYRSATELAAMIRERRATSEEITRAFIARINNHNHRYNALIWLREEEAIADARRADAAIANGDSLLGPLHGVPITIKEQFWVKGSPSTLNTKMFGFVAPMDGAAVESLKRAGAVILGTTNVPFMLSDYQTQGEVYPTASNPYDTTRTPGGSTGGGAAALAAGFTSAELGSDLGGSIRVPSAFCGLWGLKPTYGAINQTQGGWPDTTNATTRLALASPGPLARAPEDLRLMWDALRATPIDPRFQKPIERSEATARTLGQYRIAWMDEWGTPHGPIRVGQDVKQKLRMLIDSLRAHGATVERTAPDMYEELQRSFFGTFGGMMAENKPWLLRKMITAQMSGLDPGNGSFAEFAASMSDASDERWRNVGAERARLTERWVQFFRDHDLLVLPITYGAAFTKCETGSAVPGDDGPVPYTAYAPYTTIINAAGLPSLAVPMGLNQAGLPIGLQIVGPPHSEEELLHVAMLLKPLVPAFTPPTISSRR